MVAALERANPSEPRSYCTNGIGLSSERNGVPVRASRRTAGSKAAFPPSPQERESPAWWISSRMTSVRRVIVRRRCTWGAMPTWAYVRTAPWKSAEECTSALRKVGSSWMPTRPAAVDHWFLRCSVGVTTVTASTVPSASSSAAIRRAKVVFPAPGVATARKSSLRRRRYSTSARRCHARRFGLASGAGRGGMHSPPTGATQSSPRGRRPRRRFQLSGQPRSGSRATLREPRRIPALLRDLLVVDALAVGADREALRVARGHPELAAEGAHRRALHHRFHELVLRNVVREALVVALVEAVVGAFLDDRLGLGLGTSGHRTLPSTGATPRAAAGTDPLVCQAGLEIRGRRVAAWTSTGSPTARRWRPPWPWAGPWWRWRARSCRTGCPVPTTSRSRRRSRRRCGRRARCRPRSAWWPAGSPPGWTRRS